MKLTRIATPLMAVAIMSSVPFMALAQNSQSGNQTQTADWNTPPAGTEQAQQGYKDGIEGAQLDKLSNRPIDFKQSHLYVHPPVKGNEAKDAYRSAFEAGYKAAVAHQPAS
jgi:hypothetical protein